MRTIPDELVKFRAEIEPNIANMEAQKNILLEKISNCSSLNTDINNSFSACYSSQNKNTIIDKFSYINEIYNKINGSLNDYLTAVIDGSNSLLGDIKKLDSLSKEISIQESLIEEDENAIAIVNSKSEEFDKLNKIALDKLNKLKSMDQNLSFVNIFNDDELESKVSDLVGGTFERRSYKASNGVKIQYYIYIPKFSSNVEKLPMHIYLHGSGENGNGVLNTGLPKMLNNNSINSEGIVLVPQAVQGGEFYKADYQAALVELATKTAEKNNGDLSRLSLSGYSNGAFAGYQFVGRYPKTFSAFIPISGDTVPYVLEKMKGSNTKFWIFHGKNDVRVSSNSAKRISSSLNAEGVDAQLYIYNDEGHMDVQDNTFKKKFEKNGKSVNPLEWAFTQKNNNYKA